MSLHEQDRKVNYIIIKNSETIIAFLCTLHCLYELFLNADRIAKSNVCFSKGVKELAQEQLQKIVLRVQRDLPTYLAVVCLQLYFT